MHATFEIYGVLRDGTSAVVTPHANAK